MSKQDSVHTAQSKHSSQGFALLAAIFILVVLSLMGVFVVRISAVSSATTKFSMQGVRAYFAAQSAFDWGAYQAVVNGSCSASTTINLSQAALSGFTAVVQCAQVVTTEGTLYNISVKSEKGTFGTIDYVSRTIAGTVIQ